MQENISKEAPQEKKKRKKRRMRLPNGIGSVHQIGDSKRRRKPWRARVPSHIEFNAETGKATQKYITLGYYETEQEAIAALFEYRKSPYTIEANTTTFADVFELWKERKYPEVSASAQRSYNAAFKNNEAIHKMKMRDIRANHLEQVMESVEGGYKVQIRLKSFWNQIFKYAMEHDIIQKNYAEFVKPRDKDEGTKRTAIPPEDVAKIWQLTDEGGEIGQAAEIALIYIYTGFRATELLEVKKEDVDLAGRIIVGGLKTDAGKDRRVPIHKAILPFVERLMNNPGETLITHEYRGKHLKVSYPLLNKNYWSKVMERLGDVPYTCHYARHTCATMLRIADVPEDLRKLILGHANGDITDRYTHHTDDMLLEAIDMVPGR